MTDSTPCRFQRAWALHAALVALALVVVVAPQAAMAQSRTYGLELGAGTFIPLDQEHRDDYGNGALASLGVTSQLTPTGAWLLCDVGVTRNRGQELAFDPTFVTEEATLWLVPIRVGVRRDLVPPTYEGYPRVYFGVALQTTIATASVPLLETQTSAAFGAAFEVSLDLVGGDHWRLWLRQALALSSSVRLAPELRALDLSGAQLQAGLGYTFR